MGNRAMKQALQRSKDWMMLLLPGPISTAIISAVIMFFARFREPGWLDYTGWAMNVGLLCLTLWQGWEAAKDSNKDKRDKSFNSIIGQVAAGCGAFLIAMFTQLGWLLILVMVGEHAYELYLALAPLLGAMQQAGTAASSGEDGGDDAGKGSGGRKPGKKARGSKKNR